MAYKRNHSKKCNNWIWVLAFFGVIISGAMTDGCWAAFASKFSMSVGEQFTDNLFFDKDKEHDFVTVITPTLTLLFAPQGGTVPTININISPSAQLYSRHSDLNNFGRNMSMNGSYNEQLTPRLSLSLTDTLSSNGATRLGGLGGGGPPTTPTSNPIPGSVPSNSTNQNLQNFTSVGNVISNSFALGGGFLYQPNLRFNANYSNTFVSFLSKGGSDIFQTIGLRGVYNWRQEHNLHAGYSVSIASARNGASGLIHNFDVGDDFFSNVQLRLSPTLTIALSSGFSINTGSQGSRIANNSNLAVTKVWQTATLTGGVRKGLTPSFGISGISDTTTFYGNFDSRLTERVNAKAEMDLSIHDTDDVNFRTFRSTAALTYLINSWLSSNLSYNFRSSNNGAGSSNSTLLQKGTVRSNDVLLSFIARFDLWPNLGLSRGISSSSAVPLIIPPFSSSQTPAGSVDNPNP